MKIITIKRASDSAIISTIAQIGNPASEIMSKCATKKLHEMVRGGIRKWINFSTNPLAYA